MKTVLSRPMRRLSAMAGACAAIAAASVAVAAPAQAAPSSADTIPLPRPWVLSWSGGKASGLYTVTQPTLGIGRTYTVSGAVTSLISGQCYFVRVAGDGLGRSQDSPSSCGPSAPATFSIKVLTYGAGAVVTVRLCRGLPGMVPACGPVTRL